MHWTCGKCGSELRFDSNNIECSNPNCKPYKNHCWNCGSTVTSFWEKKSKIPGMGFVCSTCGEDLQGWKLAKGLITFKQLAILRENANAILR